MLLAASFLLFTTHMVVAAHSTRPIDLFLLLVVVSFSFESNSIRIWGERRSEAIDIYTVYSRPYRYNSLDVLQCYAATGLMALKWTRRSNGQRQAETVEENRLVISKSAKVEMFFFVFFGSVARIRHAKVSNGKTVARLFYNKTRESTGPITRRPSHKVPHETLPLSLSRCVCVCVPVPALCLGPTKRRPRQCRKKMEPTDLSLSVYCVVP